MTMWKKKLEVRDETRDDGARVYTLKGCLFGSPDGYGFQDSVRKDVAAGVGRIVIDLAAVERIDSSGIGILVATMWSASNAGSGLALASISTRVEKVLSIAMLLDHIEHADSVDAALAKLDRDAADATPGS